MIVSSPELQFDDGVAHLSARIEMEKRRIQLPETLWFEYSGVREGQVSDRADGFAATLLLLAMGLGEPLRVQGQLSPRLAYGMREYQRYFSFWFPTELKPVQIEYKSADPSPEAARSTEVGSAFSGGVDSFFTVWSHLPANERDPSAQISRLLLVQGFEIPLSDTRTFDILSRNYADLAHRLGLELVQARTNARDFLPGLDWSYTHGAALIGTMLGLGPLFRRFYLPGTYTYSEAFPWGSDPRIDHLLSTQDTEVIHHAPGLTRVDKLAVLAEWPETYTRLRVCWEKPDGLYNCCVCNKCVRTMITLDLLGVLPRYTTFRLPLTRQAIRNYWILNASDRALCEQVIDYAAARGRRDVVVDLRIAVARSALRLVLRKVKRKIRGETGLVSVWRRGAKLEKGFS